MKSAPFARIKSLLSSIRYRVYKTPHEKVIAAWNAKDGDRTLRLDYSLTEKSIVLDLGGYEGQWASDIFARYRCDVIVFEPVREFADKIRDRFQLNLKVRVVEAAVGENEGELRLNHAADASSSFNVGGNATTVKKIDFLDYLDLQGVIDVDLVKMNIEGSEYELLEYLIKMNALSRFRNLQIQFHRCVPNFEQRVVAIRRQLERTHTLSWQFPLVWENWERLPK